MVRAHFHAAETFRHIIAHGREAIVGLLRIELLEQAPCTGVV